MKTAKLRFLLLFLGLITLSGCIPYAMVVTNNSKYKGDYREGQKYELQQDAFLINWHDFAERWSQPLIAVLTPNYSLGGLSPTNSLHTTPESYEEYLNDPKKWADHIDGIIPKGTKLEFDKLIYSWWFEDDGTTPVARILDGKFKGWKVSLNLISRRPSSKDSDYYKNQDYYRYFVDTNWLIDIQ